MNYYKKLLKTYLFITSLFIIIISLTFIFGYRYVIRKEQQVNNEIIFEQACEYTDMKLSSLQEIIQLLSTSDCARKYAAETATQTSRYNRIQLSRLLTDIASIGQPYCTLLVTTASNNHYCSNSLSVELNELKYGIHSLSLTETQFYEIIDSFSETYTTETRLIPLSCADGTSKIIIAAKLLFNRSYPLYFFASYNQSDLFLLNHSDSYEFAMVLEDQTVLCPIGVSSEKMKQFYTTAADSAAMQHTSEFYDQNITYIMRQMTDFSGGSVILLILLFSAAALLVSISLMFHLTRRMYSPIRETLDITDNVFESEDEFLSIQNNVLSLKNNVSRLENQLQQFHSPAQTKFIHDLLMGLIPPESIPELCAKYNIQNLGKHYIVTIVQIHVSPDIAPEDACSLIYKVRSQIIAAIALESSKNLNLFRTVDLNLAEHAYIFYDTDTHLLANIFRSACTAPLSDPTSDITVAFGNVCNDLSELSNSFLYASHLITQAQHSPSPIKVLIHGESELPVPAPYTVYYPLNMEQALINAVISQNTNTWKTLLQYIIDTNCQKNSGSPAHLAIMLTATFDRILNAANVNSSTAWDNQLLQYQMLHSCKNYEELFECSNRILDELSALLSQVTASDSRMIRTRMLNFIHTNYTKDISLLDLAEHLNMSRNYVSTLFKELIGKNFKDYLSEYRVEKVCELITEKKGKIKLLDVAAAVGCNASSLQRLFSHYKGMSPSEWMAAEYLLWQEDNR